MNFVMGCFTKAMGYMGTQCGHVTHRLRKDRKSTRLNSSHTVISYAVFCLKKKKKIDILAIQNDLKFVLEQTRYIMSSLLRDSLILHLSTNASDRIYATYVAIHARLNLCQP